MAAKYATLAINSLSLSLMSTVVLAGLIINWLGEVELGTSIAENDSKFSAIASSSMSIVTQALRLAWENGPMERLARGTE